MTAVKVTTIGKYKLIRHLGEGGIGCVYLAKSEGQSPPVAIKVIRANMIDKRSIIQRFYREISVCKQLEHPFVVRLIDGGLDIEQNIPYLVMENLEGMSLMTLIKDGDLTIQRVYQIFSQQAQALAYIHKKGVIHRDIKADNIMVISEERSVLIDFGLVMIDANTRLSKTGDCIGTLPMMSPEQLRSEKLKKTSDIYNLGMTIYHSLTGELPYKINDIILMSKGQTPAQVFSPSKIKNEIPKSLSSIVMKCINCDEKMRYQDTEALITALDEIHDEVIKLPESKGSASGCRELTTSPKILKRKGTPKNISTRKSGKFLSKGIGSSPVIAPKKKKTARIAAFLSIVIFLTFVFASFMGDFNNINKTKSSSTAKENLSEKRWPKTKNGNIGDTILPNQILENLGKALLSQTIQTFITTKEQTPRSVVHWMQSIDEYLKTITTSREANPSKVQLLAYIPTLTEIKSHLPNNNIKLYIDGQKHMNKGQYIVAATNFRNAATPLLEDIYSAKPAFRKTNLLAAYILAKISECFSKVLMKDVSLSSDEECNNWLQWILNLPAKETLTKDVYFLRCWLFISNAINSYKGQNTKAREKTLNYALAFLLKADKTNALSDANKMFLMKLINSIGFFSTDSVAETSTLDIDLHKLLSKLSRQDAVFFFMRPSKGEEKSFDTIETEFKRKLWLFLSVLLCSPDDKKINIFHLFNRSYTIPKFAPSASTRRLLHEFKLTELKILRCKTAMLPTLTDQQSRIYKERSSVVYAERFLREFAHILNDRQKDYWHNLALIPGEDKFFSQWIEATASNETSPGKLITSSVSCMRNLVDEDRFPKLEQVHNSETKKVFTRPVKDEAIVIRASNERTRIFVTPMHSSVIRHKMSNMETAVITLGRSLIKKWPCDTNLVELEEIKDLADILDAQLKVLSAQYRIGFGDGYDELMNCDAIISFIKKLYKEGASQQDCIGVKRALYGIYDDPLDLEGLSIKLGKSKSTRQSTPWKRPPLRKHQ